jgi:hypothetical protein
MGVSGQRHAPDGKGLRYLSNRGLANLFFVYVFYIYIKANMCVCLSVCMFKINSLTPELIPTKFCVATIQNPARNIGYIRI